MFTLTHAGIEDKNQKTGSSSRQKNTIYTGSADVFPTLEELVAGEDQFDVIGIGQTKPFPLVSQVSPTRAL